jgi:hypothetical protein
VTVAVNRRLVASALFLVVLFGGGSTSAWAQETVDVGARLAELTAEMAAEVSAYKACEDDPCRIAVQLHLDDLRSRHDLLKELEEKVHELPEVVAPATEQPKEPEPSIDLTAKQCTDQLQSVGLTQSSPFFASLFGQCYAAVSAGGTFTVTMRH